MRGWASKESSRGLVCGALSGRRDDAHDNQGMIRVVCVDVIQMMYTTGVQLFSSIDSLREG